MLDCMNDNVLNNFVKGKGVRSKTINLHKEGENNFGVMEPSAQ